MERKLERNPQNKMIAGVASGLAEYLEMDVTLMRVLFVLAVVFGFSGLLIYVVMWVILPERPFQQNFNAFNADLKPKESAVYSDVRNPGPSYSGFSQSGQAPLPLKKNTGSGRTIVGLFLIASGVYFMLAEFHIIPDWFSIIKLWPLVIIVIGLGIMFKSEKKPLERPVMNWEETPEQQNSSNTAHNQPLS